MSRPRLAYLLKRFPRLSETFILNEILELKRQGLEARVYALEDPLEKQVHPEAARLRSSVAYLHDPHRRAASWLSLLRGAAVQAASNPLGLLRVLWALARVHRSLPSVRHALEGIWLAGDLRRSGITHLHAHFIHSPAAVAYFAFLAGGIPFSVTAHAKDLYTTLERNLRIRACTAKFLMTCTKFNADHLHQVLGERHGVRIEVLYHGSDLGRFTPERSQVEAGRILSVGRLVPKKGFADLVKAVALLRAREIPFRAEIFGGGPLREELEEHGRRLGLAERLTFHGARVQDDIVAAYRRAAVFVLAPIVSDNGDRDGIPNVLVEAMASGVPVVSTRISGIPELITDGIDGLLVNPHDPGALADAIGRVLLDPSFGEWLGRAARKRVERDFDLQVNTRRLLSLFKGTPGEAFEEAA